MRDNQRIRELKENVADLEATIRAARAARAELREQIRLEQQAQQSAGLHERDALQVISRWDTGMTVNDIASALGCSATLVQQTITEFRKREHVTVRRGQQIREHRRVRAKKGRADESHGAR